MSWMQKLYETYEHSLKLDLPDDQKPIPICHTVQNAHINIVIDGAGNFIRAKVLEKTQITLPVTEKSAGKTSGEAPHPLAEAIQYIAGDYQLYGGKKKAYFPGYKRQLEEWTQSEYSNKSIEAVFTYVIKESVVRDLVNNHICFIGPEEKLLTEWDSDEDVPLLLKLLPKEKKMFYQGKALICWTVESQEIECADTWKDQKLYNSWINYYQSLSSEENLCDISGELIPIASNHPAKLRHSGDKAKLISANDSSGFTFRGRFTDKTQVASVGFVTTQKAHNALRWLIGRQGARNGDQVTVAWAVRGQNVPQPMDQGSVLDLDEDDFSEDIQDDSKQKTIDHARDVGQSFARRLAMFMKGYKAQFSEIESIIIMTVDSATPGRMGIVYYQEFFAHQYIDQLSKWYEDFTWYQRMSKEIPQKRGKPKSVTYWPISAPTPWVIVESAYGKVLKSADVLKKKSYERILPCITEGKNIPLDIMMQCINRAKCPESMDHWEWERTLGVACALYKGYYTRHPDEEKRRHITMALDLNNKSRDYLYGRLLAVSEKIENYALFLADIKRPTTAEKLMNRFADHPFTTWPILERQMRPYVQQLMSKRPGLIHTWNNEIDTIMNSFEKEEFCDDRKLSGEFLLGFHCQRLVLNSKKKDTNEEKE